MREYFASVVSRCGAGLLVAKRLSLAAVILTASVAISMATDPPPYELPDTGFGPTQVVLLGTQALDGWSGYLTVVLPIALAIGLCVAGIGWFMGLFGARRAVTR